MTDYYKRGDVLYVNFGNGIGSEQSGVRPALVLQNDVGNKYSQTIIVASITSSHKKDLPTHIPLSCIDFLEPRSVLLMEQIRTIDLSRVIKYMGHFRDNLMGAIDQALSISVGLEKRKPKGMVISLCSQCANIFYDSPYHTIHRLDPNQIEKEPCTYCSVRDGYSFKIHPVKNMSSIKAGE